MWISILKWGLTLLFNMGLNHLALNVFTQVGLN